MMRLIVISAEKSFKNGKRNGEKIFTEAEDLLIEVDEFEDANKGLTLAEIELPYEDYQFERSPWLGREVTGDDIEVV